MFVVSAAVHQQRAKELGEKFVRLVKRMGPDDPPGRNIGEGDYDCLIGVYYPNESPSLLLVTYIARQDGEKFGSGPITPFMTTQIYARMFFRMTGPTFRASSKRLTTITRRPLR